MNGCPDPQSPDDPASPRRPCAVRLARVRGGPV